MFIGFSKPVESRLILKRQYWYYLADPRSKLVIYVKIVATILHHKINVISFRVPNHYIVILIVKELKTQFLTIC